MKKPDGEDVAEDRRFKIPKNLKLVGKVAMTRKRYKCNYIPLIKLSSLLTKLREGEGILVSVERSRFSLESVMALAKAYGARSEILSNGGDLAILLLVK